MDKFTIQCQRLVVGIVTRLKIFIIYIFFSWEEFLGSLTILPLRAFGDDVTVLSKSRDAVDDTLVSILDENQI